MAVGETIWMISCDPVLIEQVQLLMPSKELKICHQDNGNGAPAQIKAISPALVIVDKTLQGTNGFSLCREIRKEYDGPILLMDEVKEYNGIDRSIDVYISRIRQQLGDDPCDPVYLKTVRGVGYLFTGPDSA